jgi:hypothetical protein
MTNKEKIIQAAKVDDLKEIFELIDQGTDPFTMDCNGRTAISYVFSTIDSAQMKKLSKKIARYLYIRNK